MDQEEDGSAWRLRAVRLSLACWAAILIILLTLTEESWLGKLILRVDSKPDHPIGFVEAVALYVAFAAAGVMASGFYLLARQKTREGWWGYWLAGLSFTVMAGMLFRLLLYALPLGWR